MNTSERPKIYERNPDTGVIRWRYLGENPLDYGWHPYIFNYVSHSDIEEAYKVVKSSEFLIKNNDYDNDNTNGNEDGMK